MVLILTDSFDKHADVVISKLIKNNIPFYRFDLDVEHLKRSYISFSKGCWVIKSDSGNVSTNQISCVWCRRPFVELTLEERVIEDVDFKIWKNEWNNTLLGLYNSLKVLPWLNPLREAFKGENKYYQMEVAEKVGFSMPDTLVSNNKDELIQFVKHYGQAVLKLMTQDVYTVNNEFKGLYTNILNEQDIEQFSTIEENPIVLQRYIDKKFEVRYTVVGDEHFVCKIDSQKSDRAKYDWRRYDIPSTPHSKMLAPDDIRVKVADMLKILGLEYGALDFIVTPEDKWIFLEINCMGQWLWIEQLANLSISDAIVNWIKKIYCKEDGDNEGFCF